MPGLKCQAADCVYNMGRACSAHTIRVSRTPSETFCDTYSKDSPMVTAEKQRLLDGMRVEFSADIGAPKILCTVSECAHNKAFHCRAGRVDIDDAHDATVCNCLTYRPK
jgi:hypothetical protein